MYIASQSAVLRLRGLIYHMRVFFYERAEKVLSYARLNCAVFNYFPSLAVQGLGDRTHISRPYKLISKFM